MTYPRLLVRTLTVLVGVLGLSTVLTIPATAEPTNDPCPLAMSLLCRFVPIAPDLDDDVDLTTPLPPSDLTESPADSQPRTDVCVNGYG